MDELGPPEIIGTPRQLVSHEQDQNGQEKEPWEHEYDKIVGDTVQGLVESGIINQLDIENATEAQLDELFERFLENNFLTHDAKSDRFALIPPISIGSRKGEKIKAIFNSPSPSPDKLAEIQTYQEIANNYLLNNPEVKAVILYGSRVSERGYVDQRSDLDVCIVVDDVNSFRSQGPESMPGETLGWARLAQADFEIAGLDGDIELGLYVEGADCLSRISSDSMPCWARFPDSIICCDRDGKLNHELGAFFGSPEYKAIHDEYLLEIKKRFVAAV